MNPTPPSPYDGDTSPAKLGRKGLLTSLALVVATLIAGALTLDRLFPPDLSRYQERSSETVDANGRLLARTDNSLSILFWSSAVIVIGAAFSALFGWEPVTPAQWGWYLMAGAVNFAAHFLIIEALRLGRAAVVAPFRYTSLLWSAILGFAIWGDVPDRWVWIGSAILIASGLWIMQSQKG